MNVCTPMTRKCAIGVLAEVAIANAKTKRIKTDLRRYIRRKGVIMKRDYYCLLTNGYETQECQTMEEVFQKIENCLKKNNLSYEKIF